MLGHGAKFASGRFQLGNKIGKGAYGEIYSGKSKALLKR